MFDSFRAHATGHHIGLASPDMTITIRFDKPVVVDTIVGLIATNNKRAGLFSCSTMKAGESTVEFEWYSQAGAASFTLLEVPGCSMLKDRHEKTVPVHPVVVAPPTSTT